MYIMCVYEICIIEHWHITMMSTLNTHKLNI